jgi:hypothetical protein
VKKNYPHLSSEQKQKIATEESEIVFSYPYLIGFIMDEQTSKPYHEEFPSKFPLNSFR